MLIDTIEVYTEFQIVLLIGIIPILAVLIWNFYKSGLNFARVRMLIYYTILLSAAFILIAGYLADMDTEYLTQSIYYDMESDGLFSLVTDELYSAVVYFVVFLLIKSTIRNTRTQDGKNEMSLWIACGAFSTIYASSMASGAEIPFYGVMIGLSFVICEALSLEFADKVLEAALKGFTIAVCTVLSFACIAQKDVSAYSWWGGQADQTRNEKVYATDIPALKGFYFSEELRDTYEAVVDLINENCDEDAVIYGFPYVKIFNILTDRYNFETFVPVMFYDVVDDSYVEYENELLKANLPDILIIQDIPGCLEAHEFLFRDGELLEQRNTLAFFEEVIPTSYETLGSFSNLTVYKLTDSTEETQPDETEIDLVEAGVFAGGSGTYQDPYLLETSDQLLKFSQAVNEGECFEGFYIKQTADIDLSDVENWIPIGKYEGEYAFLGTYDGGGHVIANLHCYATEDCYNLGLFGKLGGTVCNLGLEGGIISGSCCGGIASHSSGYNAQIINCYTSIDIEGYRVGGIADNFVGTVKNCFSVGKLSGEESADLISYNVHGGCNILNSYILDGSYESGLYIKSEHSDDIINCGEDYINSDLIVSLLNNVVDGENGVSGDGNLVLVNWCVGDDHPVFDIK